MRIWKLNNIIFNCTSEGSIEDKRLSYIEYLKDPNKFIGQKYCVKYQSIDSQTGIPRFPVGKGIRYDMT